MFQAAVLYNASTKPFSLGGGQKENEQLTISKGHWHLRNSTNLRMEYKIFFKCAKLVKLKAEETEPVTITVVSDLMTEK